MRIVLASTFSSWTDGAHRRVFDDLATSLRGHDHVVDQVSLPFDRRPERMIEQMLAIRLTDISDAGELLITLRAPSHLLEHPNKVIWFEPHDGEMTDRLVRRSALATDSATFAGARRAFSVSAAAAELLRQDLGRDTEVLEPPAQLGREWDVIIERLLG